jgi:hypothetical protein
MAEGILVVLLALIGIAVVIVALLGITGILVINEEAQDGVTIRVEETTKTAWGKTTGGNVSIIDVDGLTTFLGSMCGFPGLVLLLLLGCAIIGTAWGLSH